MKAFVVRVLQQATERSPEIDDREPDELQRRGPLATIGRQAGKVQPGHQQQIDDPKPGPSRRAPGAIAGELCHCGAAGKRGQAVGRREGGQPTPDRCQSVRPPRLWAEGNLDQGIQAKQMAERQDRHQRPPVVVMAHRRKREYRQNNRPNQEPAIRLPTHEAPKRCDLQAKGRKNRGQMNDEFGPHIPPGENSIG